MKIYGIGKSIEEIWMPHDSPNEYLKSANIDLSIARNIEEYLCKVPWREYLRTKYELLEEYAYTEVDTIEEFFKIYPTEAVEDYNGYLFLHTACG